MRLFLSPPEKHVAIIIDEKSLTCAWLERPSSRAPFIIKAYIQKELTAPNSADCLFDPTDIGTTISHFIKKQMPANSFKHALISCAFAPQLVRERLAKLNHATPSAPADFQNYDSHSLSLRSTGTHESKQSGSATQARSHAKPPANPLSTVWDYLYLYPTDSHEYVFYVCGIAQSLLLQYKLIALSYKFNLCTTSSQTAALFKLYRYIQGAAFRSSQLSIDMQRARNNPELLFSTDMVRRIITVPEHKSGIDKKTVLALAGLVCTEI